VHLRTCRLSASDKKDGGSSMTLAAQSRTIAALTCELHSRKNGWSWRKGAEEGRLRRRWLRILCGRGEGVGGMRVRFVGKAGAVPDEDCGRISD
jgi:hypothetical protein